MIIAPPLPEGYDYQTCGLCHGIGKDALDGDEPCRPCKGTGRVMVYDPPIECARCAGIGRASSKDEIIYSSGLCVVCRGSGWIMTRMS
jgi:DnaJ-class molecular chaperone